MPLNEAYGTPKRLQEIATSYGGTNPYGEPIYRVVWGSERKMWKYRDSVGVAYLPKYSPRNRERFHVEKWLPPEFYGTPESWRRDTVRISDGAEVETLGPFPSRGDYETLFTFETPEGKYLEPTTDLLVAIIKRNHWASSRMVDDDIIQRRREDSREADAKNSHNRGVMRELTKEFLEKALPGRTVQQLKSELTAPRR